MITEQDLTSRRPFSLDDLSELKGVSSPQLSPDGTQIVCAVTTTDVDANTRRDVIALLSLTDNQLDYLFEGSSPAWSPDGTAIAYEGDNNSQHSIWIYHIATKEKRCITPIYESAYFMGHLVEKKFAWSPDGKYIAYLSADKPTTNMDGPEVRVFSRLLYKSKGGRGRSFYTDNALTHIWVVPAAGGEPEELTPGAYNEHSICWSPDSRYLAFVSNRSADPDNNQQYDLWTVDCETKKVVRLTQDFGTAFQPAWSPDGATIAFLATRGALATNDSPAEDTHLYLIVPDGNGLRCITKTFDRRIENIRWHPAGTAVYFTAGNHGDTPVYKIDISTSEIKTVIGGNFHVLEYAISSNGGDIVYVSTGTVHPPELFLYNEADKQSRQLTTLHNSLVSTCSFQKGETFWFSSFDATPVQGWLMKPARFDNAKTYPMVLVIHGGPHNMFGYEFEDRMQLLAAEGYAVLYLNPRGSSGYGQAFSSGCVLNWGGGDYKDLMAGIDHVLKQNTWIDGGRLGVTGQSYGGFMTNWIITQTARFKAAVSDGGLSNLISFTGTSLYHSLMESEFNGPASDNYPLLWQWSPLRHATQVKTPTLFLHGEVDNEVPFSQAEEMYVALKKGDVKTELVQYVGEGHGWRPELKPANRQDLLRRTVDWFKEHIP